MIENIQKYSRVNKLFENHCSEMKKMVDDLKSICNNT